MYKCKNCNSRKYIKSEFANGKQRYKCKECGYQSAIIKERIKSEKERLTAVWLYLHGFSMRAIAKFLKVSAGGVSVWVRSFAEKSCTKIPLQAKNAVKLDEMWRFLRLKKQKSGSELISTIPDNLSFEKVLDEVMTYSQEFKKD